MNEEDRLIFNELKSKILNIIDLYKSLEEDKRQLEGEIVILKEKMALIEQKNVDLVHKYENLKLANTIESGYEDNQEAKQKIKGLMREIDKCIALLNR